MSLIVNTNISSLAGATRSTQRSEVLDTAFARVSSGSRVDTQMDDAGLIMREDNRVRISSLSQAAAGMEEAVSIIQEADKGLSQISTLLKTQRELMTQTASTGDRQTMAGQLTDLVDAVDAVVADTSFAGVNLLGNPFTTFAASPGVGAAGGEAGGGLTVASTVTGVATGFDSAGLGLNVASDGLAVDTAGVLDQIDAAQAEIARQRQAIDTHQRTAIRTASAQVGDAIGSLAGVGSQSRSGDTSFIQNASRVSASIVNDPGIALQAQANLQPEMALALLG